MYVIIQNNKIKKLFENKNNIRDKKNNNSTNKK